MSEVAHRPSHADSHPGHTSIWPLVITLGVALLFWGIAFNLLGMGLWVLVAGLGVLVAGLVGWLRETFLDLFVAEDEPPGETWPFQGISKLKLGMWAFMAGDILLFGVVLGVDVYLRMKSLAWPAAGEVFKISYGTAMTYILLASAFTFSYAVMSIRRGNMRGVRLGLVATLLLGLGFLAIKIMEWSELFAHGFNFNSGLPASTYFFTTGLHGLHVLIGLLGILYFLVALSKGIISKERHETLALFGLYWIFVDLVWLFIFPIIYLW